MFQSSLTRGVSPLFFARDFCVSLVGLPWGGPSGGSASPGGGPCEDLPAQRCFLWWLVSLGGLPNGVSMSHWSLVVTQWWFALWFAQWYFTQ